MKIKYLSIILVAGFISTAAIQINKECDATALKKELKRELRPDYKYDSSKITRIKARGYSSNKEVEVPLFIGEHYKFIFNTAQLQSDVVISVYNKKAGKNNRVLLYSNKDDKSGDKSTFEWEPEKSRTMYINYEIPKGTTGDGCVVFLLGYKI